MPDATKITLSSQELKIVEDTSWVLTKQEIIKTVYEIFHCQVLLIGEIVLEKKGQLPVEILSVIPKISRGENYQGLPYVMLDYPSIFQKDNIFALRTMFWWGNFFSVTLHLSGRHKVYFEENIIKNLTTYPSDGLFFCINYDAWEHHFKADNYVPLEVLSILELRDYIFNKHFLKIALKIELRQWNNLNEFLPPAYKQILKLLSR